ncbi:hypothetical protein I4F81_000755 [Pyropia yezoensis]|uniref:Uncharacterized protein n=1 Tax=Pyropia yezoensis TaxID=2788 RepID=A0ACC3BJQ5_PYRYE|nr:hypothetical protein I4F81_000755 [Neopyropia yezoensis]
MTSDGSSSAVASSGTSASADEDVEAAEDAAARDGDSLAIAIVVGRLVRRALRNAARGRRAAVDAAVRANRVAAGRHQRAHIAALLARHTRAPSAVTGGGVGDSGDGSGSEALGGDDGDAGGNGGGCGQGSDASTRKRGKAPKKRRRRSDQGVDAGESVSLRELPPLPPRAAVLSGGTPPAAPTASASVPGAAAGSSASIGSPAKLRRVGSPSPVSSTGVAAALPEGDLVAALSSIPTPRVSAMSWWKTIRLRSATPPPHMGCYVPLSRAFRHVEPYADARFVPYLGDTEEAVAASDELVVETGFIEANSDGSDASEAEAELSTPGYYSLAARTRRAATRQAVAAVTLAPTDGPPRLVAHPPLSVWGGGACQSA